MIGEWISVKERLPEVGVTVLGWDSDGHHTLHQYCGKLKSGGDMWLGCHLAGGEYEDGMIGYEPEYWMPLPGAATRENRPLSRQFFWEKT